jgi:hypothetical protein
MAGKFILKIPDFHVAFRNLLHAVILRHGTHTSLSKEGVLRIFFALKNPTASAGFDTENLGSKGQHATSRPPKPLKPKYCLVVEKFVSYTLTLNVIMLLKVEFDWLLSAMSQNCQMVAFL